jgi:hypothetical protein
MSVLLSTKDNPYNPHTEWDEWLSWDTDHGYHTLSLLGRVVRSSDELSEYWQQRAIEDAMNEIVSYNVSGQHILVEPPKEVETP